ncbi:unnamed protein product [Cladocopium goreaui]|uniref:C3H1-type domain-containing protein n=1 Tax=Cladocopium goreaui TaxID=2562237 RepID=A0A9P1M4S8_9DINO|nr:unnamed protein product [Cladocopium goreaui]|mmetsp:Transcript_77639/g.171505  ORF Transcript_77639/g.171505 Transcript_77639/m.171505 type:complete len:119 (-) Transcript_77639:24-380(-)
MEEFRNEVIGTLQVSQELVTVTLRHGSIDVVVEGQGAALVRSHSSPCLPRWVKPGEGPSQLDRHLSGLCRPCLFFTRKADGCLRGDTCDHCHLCSAEQTRRKLNRAKAERRARRLAAQ